MPLGESLTTVLAHVGFLSSVNSLMAVQVGLVGERLGASLARKGTLARVRALVILHPCLPLVRFGAESTLERFVTRMDAHMALERSIRLDFDSARCTAYRPALKLRMLGYQVAL